VGTSPPSSLDGRICEKAGPVLTTLANFKLCPSRLSKQMVGKVRLGWVLHKIFFWKKKLARDRQTDWLAGFTLVGRMCKKALKLRMCAGFLFFCLTKRPCKIFFSPPTLPSWPPSLFELIHILACGRMDGWIDRWIKSILYKFILQGKRVVLLFPALSVFFYFVATASSIVWMIRPRQFARTCRLTGWWKGFFFKNKFYFIKMTGKNQATSKLFVT